MAGRFNDLIQSTFRIRENEGEDKVVSLKQAIERNIKPGAKYTLARPTAVPVPPSLR